MMSQPRKIVPLLPIFKKQPMDLPEEKKLLGKESGNDSKLVRFASEVKSHHSKG
jgi:hypothetical protein